MQFTLLNQENQAYWEATYIEAFPEEETAVWSIIDVFSSRKISFVCYSRGG